MMNQRMLSMLLSTLLLCALFTGCGAAVPPSEDPQPAGSAAEEPPAPGDETAEPSPNTESSVEGTVQVPNGERTLELSYIPQKVVCLNMQMTEMMLALDLADHILYTCYTNAEPLAEFREAFEKIPLLSEKYPSHEELVAAGPDLVLGQVYGFTDKNSDTVEMLAEKDIPAYVSEGTMAERESIEHVYEDILGIGKIFRVEDRAEALVAGMKAKVDETAEKTAGIDPKARVFVVDSISGNEIWTAGRCMETEAINLAGAVNVMEAGTEEQWPTVSAELLLEHNPDILMFNSYGSTAVEDKIKAVEENPALADLDAVKNKRYVIVALQDVNESVRLADTVVRLAAEFYPEQG